jgi:tRNA modification GTPase
VLHAVDQVVVTWFEAPHSYTGEDVVEISGHGSPVLLEHIVTLAIHAGARLAEPGEFTLRAYLNGRLDLVQAEAVGDLISAVTPAQARVAMDQLDGTITTAIQGVDAVLFALIAKCEASLDFPEEGFHFVQPGDIARELEGVADTLQSLLDTAARGRLIREGRVVAISGRPNTGKSSLFNALLGRGRAIVTDVPGTTRDLLTERVDLIGVPVTLIDTAGIRASVDPIEQEGISRAHAARLSAEVALVVLDVSAPLTDIDHQLLSETSKTPRIIAVNKNDCAPAWNPAGEAWHNDVVVTSAKTGAGMDELRARIVGEMSGSELWRDTPTLTNIRHITLIESAREAVDLARAALESGATEELLLIDLHEARHRLEEVTGHRGAEDVLRHIFSTFCIGK